MAMEKAREVSMQSEELSMKIVEKEGELSRLCDLKIRLTEQEQTDAVIEDVKHVQLEIIRKDNEIKALWMEMNR